MCEHGVVRRVECPPLSQYLLGEICSSIQSKLVLHITSTKGQLKVILVIIEERSASQGQPTLRDMP